MELEKICPVVRHTLEELKAIDIVELDVSHQTSYMSTMFICSGTSNRHTGSIAQQVIEAVKKFGASILGIEGEKTGEWVLVDLGDVVVHVMLPDTREFYSLERLWSVDVAEAAILA